MKNRLQNYVRAHRRRTGLSQLELGLILGYRDEGAVSRHELFRSVPPLLIALGYEIVLKVPVSELFAGLREAVEDAVEKRISEFEKHVLEQTIDKGNSSALIRRKAEWLRQRHTSPA